MLTCNLKLWQPFRSLARLDEDFDNLVKNFFDTLATGFEGSWLPAVDIAEKNRNLEIKAEIPGVKKEDLKIKITDNTLTIRGKRERKPRQRINTTTELKGSMAASAGQSHFLKELIMIRSRLPTKMVSLQ